VPGDGAPGARCRQAEPERRVAGHRDRGDTFHRIAELAVSADGGVGGLWSNDQGVVAVADEVFCYAYYAVCDTVDIGWEGLRNDRDPHVIKFAHGVFEFRQDAVTAGRTIDDN
jgi:hypothetical protein